MKAAGDGRPAFVEAHDLRSLGGGIVSNDAAAFHYKLCGFQNTDVGKRIAGDSHDVRVVTRIEHPDFASPAKKTGGVNRGSPDGVDRLHAPLHHFCELPSVVAVGINTGAGLRKPFLFRIPTHGGNSRIAGAR